MTFTDPTGIVLFAHGSRDPAWKAPMERIAQLIGQISPTTPVTCAYLELDQPDLHTACAQMMQSHPELACLRVMPLFLGMGRHARQDLPALMQSLKTAHPHMRFEVLASVGESSEVLGLVARLALQSTEA
ncbi:MAG: hypothetical protein RL758_1112 [Pseudomonadota bacterium]|jgi:sirohydrochlorin cobaltochelatase